MSRDKARDAAYNAMRDVIQNTARVNGARLIDSCPIEGIGVDVLAGALDGIISYAVEARPADVLDADYARHVASVFESILDRRMLWLSTPANRRPL